MLAWSLPWSHLIITWAHPLLQHKFRTLRIVRQNGEVRAFLLQALRHAWLTLKNAASLVEQNPPLPSRLATLPLQ